MTERRSYPNPPIVEAVVEFKLASLTARESLVRELEHSLGAAYSGQKRQQEIVGAELKVSGASLETKATREIQSEFLRSEDGLRLIGCANGVLSVHALAPYPGWEQLSAQCKDAVLALPGTVRAAGFAAITARYIDKIVLPEDFDGDLAAYLWTIPAAPEAFPVALTGFRWTSNAFDTEKRQSVSLTVAGLPAEERATLLYDLAISQLPGDDGIISESDWPRVIEDLHKRQRDIFEQSITDKMRSLFS